MIDNEKIRKATNEEKRVELFKDFSGKIFHLHNLQKIIDFILYLLH